MRTRRTRRVLFSTVAGAAVLTFGLAAGGPPSGVAAAAFALAVLVSALPFRRH